MVDRQKLKAVIVLNGETQASVAKHLGMTQKTFSTKMRKGVFGSDEIESMIDYLHINEPMPIFFAKSVT